MKKIIPFLVVFLLLFAISYGLEITSYSPEDLNVVMNEGSTQEFTQESGPETDLIYSWGLYKVTQGDITSTNKVVFTRQRKIFSMNSDGSNQLQLTSESINNDTYPSISPDGTKITFRRDGNIWTMNSDGSNQLKLTEKVPANTTWLFNRPSWTQDNKIIYENKGEIWIMNSDGSNQLQLTQKFPENITALDSFRDPFVSNDGKIYSIYNRLIWAMNPDGSSQAQLTYRVPSNSSERYNYPSVSPDGAKVAYIYKKYVYREGDPGKTWEPLYIFDGWVQVRGEIVQIPPEQWLYSGLEHKSVDVKGGEGVWIMNSDGTDKNALIERTPQNFIQSFNYVCWISNDEIVYENNKQLYKMSLLDKSIIQLTTKDPSLADDEEWDSYPNCGNIQSSSTNFGLVQQSNSESFVFSPIVGDAGNYILKLNVSDELTSNGMVWSIIVNPYVAPAPTGASVSSGGGGGSRNHPIVVNKTESVVKEQSSEQNQPETNTENAQSNSITGAAVANVDRGSLVNSLKSLFSAIFNWIGNFFS